MATPPESEPRVHTRMDMGAYTTWRCLGCSSNGNHHKAPPAQVHADLTGHNVQVTESVIYVAFPAGQPPVPAQTKPGGGVDYAIPFSVHPDDMASEQPSPNAPAKPGIQVHLDQPRPAVPIVLGPEAMAQMIRSQRRT